MVHFFLAGKRRRKVREQLHSLIELQKIDTEISLIHQKKKELPRKIAELDAQFGERTLKLQESRAKLDTANKAHKEREDGLKKGAELLKKTKERLSEVKTNKEYQAMLKEIDNIQEKNSRIEDEIIILLDEIDRAKEEFKDEEKKFESVSQVYEKEKSLIQEQIGRIDGELSGLTLRTSSVKENISRELMKKYETIKSRTDGRAVVRVWKGVCEGCHMNIPPQMYNELQRTEERGADELITCPHCYRIIYWDSEKNSDAAEHLEAKAQ
jgi:hypothetical protein